MGTTNRVQRFEGELHIVLTPEMAQNLGLNEGAEVSVVPISASSNGSPAEIE